MSSPFPSSRHRRRLAGLCGAAALFLAAPAPAQHADRFTQALEREAAGDFAGARALLRHPAVLRDTAQAEHARRLDLLLRTLDAAHSYLHAGYPDSAMSVVTGLRLDPVGDVYLNMRRLRMVDSLHELARQRADAAGREKLRLAQADFRAGRLDMAIEKLTALQSAKGTSRAFRDLVDAELRRAQEEKRTMSREFAASALSEFGTSSKTLLRLLGWLAVGVVMAGLLTMLVGGIRKLLPVRKGTGLAVVDLTAPEADRERQSRILMREIHRTMKEIEERGDIVPAGRVKDLDGFPYLPTNFSIMAEMRSMLADEPVTIGLFMLRPTQVLAFFESLFNLSHEWLLSGYLSAAPDGTVTLFVERVPGRRELQVWGPLRRLHAGLLRLTGRARPGAAAAMPRLAAAGGPPHAGRGHAGRWKERGTGDDAREQAIREFALHYMYDLAESKPASNWSAFLHYQRGLELLADADDADVREQLLDDAREQFQDAARQDPGNWMAKFKLAETLRRLNRPGEAIQYFNSLDRLVNGDHRGHSERLRDFLARSPDFPLVLDYHRGMTLSMFLTVEEQDRAIRIFDQLLEELAPLPVVSSPSAN
ncbi:MAG TPA: tetratricopeptide repeat protein [Longimicrobium sp.]|jgi:tetratricopeptide (TPR) repeat protein